MIQAEDMQCEVDRFRARHGIAAVGASVVSCSGEAVVGVGGTLSRDSDDVVVPGDAWHIGSCGKAMTAVVYASMVEAGEAGWDTSIGELLADLDPHPAW